MSFLDLSPDRFVGRTPSDRDRYADFLRIASICVVVLGHWLVAVVLVRNGELITGRLLAFEPWTQWSTWFLQVMPVFFIVGGFVNAGSWRRAMERSEPWAMWVRRRCKRLLTPLVPLVVLWVPLVLALESVVGLPPQWVQTAGDVVLIPA